MASGVLSSKQYKASGAVYLDSTTRSLMMGMTCNSVTVENRAVSCKRAP